MTLDPVAYWGAYMFKEGFEVQYSTDRKLAVAWPPDPNGFPIEISWATPDWAASSCNRAIDLMDDYRRPASDHIP